MSSRDVRAAGLQWSGYLGPDVTQRLRDFGRDASWETSARNTKDMEG